MSIIVWGLHIQLTRLNYVQTFSVLLLSKLKEMVKTCFNVVGRNIVFIRRIMYWYNEDKGTNTIMNLQELSNEYINLGYSSRKGINILKVCCYKHWSFLFEASTHYIFFPSPQELLFNQLMTCGWMMCGKISTSIDQ